MSVAAEIIKAASWHDGNKMILDWILNMKFDKL